MVRSIIFAKVLLFVTLALSNLYDSAAAPVRHTRSMLGTKPTKPLAGMPRFWLPPVSQLSLQVPACKFDSITETCKETDNFLLQEGSSTRLKGATFGGKALAFKVASAAYCGQFPRRNCSYPCQDNGEVCALSGVVAYGIYACPGSKAEQDVFCTAAPQADPDLCAATPECRQGSKPSACDAEFKLNFTQQQKMQYMSDWGTTRKNVWGCCEGSEARFKNGAFCDQYSSDVAGCKRQHGCSFLEDGTCALNKTQWLDENFPHNNLLAVVKKDVEQCSKVTGGAAACHAYRMYTTNPTYMTNSLKYLFSLAKNNADIPDSSCIVWN